MDGESFAVRTAKAIAAKIVRVFDEEDTPDVTKRVCLRADFWEAQRKGVFKEVVKALPQRGDIRAAMERLEDNNDFRFF